MRVSISKGYQDYIKALMEKLQTDDPKLAIEHIIGSWIEVNSKPAQAIAPAPKSPPLADSNFRFGRDYRISESRQ